MTQPLPSQSTRYQTMRLASTYANFAQNEALYQERACGTPLTAYAVAMQDYFGKPRILSIDISRWTGEIGQVIRIRARDNIMVLSVRVLIRENEASNISLEEGEARQSPDDRLLWTYTTTTHVPHRLGTRVDVSAFDLPGNKARKFLQLK